MQFNSLMDSINRQTVRDRLVNIVDMSHAAQATTDSCNKYMRELRKSHGIISEGAGDFEDFMRDVGSV